MAVYFIRQAVGGVLHTPLKYLIGDHSALCKDTSPLPSAAYVGRMQYAPTVYG